MGRVSVRELQTIAGENWAQSGPRTAPTHADHQVGRRRTLAVPAGNARRRRSQRAPGRFHSDRCRPPGPQQRRSAAEQGDIVQVSRMPPEMYP